MAIAFDLLTGGCGILKYDLCTKASIMKWAHRTFHNRCGVYVDGKKSSYKDAFSPDGNVQSMRCLGGPATTGLGRRPLLNMIPNLPEYIANNIRGASEHGI